MSEWSMRSLAEVGDIYDGPHATPTRQNTGPYFLNIASLSNGRLDLSLSDHVSEDDFARWTRRVTPVVGDLLFSYETRLGEAALMPEGVVACLGRRMALIRPNSQLVDPRFLLYSYLGPAFQKTIEQNTIHGATVNRIPLNRMGSWEILLPPFREQRGIAEVLGALDDKIVANTTIVTSTDAMVRAMYESLEGESVLVGDVATFPRVGVDPSSVHPGDLYVGLEHVGRRLMWLGNSGRASEVTSTKSSFVERDILFGKLRPYFHKVVSAPRAGICSTDILVVRGKDQSVSSLLLAALTSDAVIQDVVAASEGTRMPRTSWRDLASIAIKWPDSSEAARLASQIDTIRATALHALRENRTLVATRDALLPQLMSGKLRVRDAEAIAADAGA